MNKEVFVSYLKDQGNLDTTSIEKLKEMVEQYPFFQTARLLYLKSLKENNSTSFASELKITSVYAGSRAMLFKLMKNKSPKQKQETFLPPPQSQSPGQDMMSRIMEPLLFEHIATTTPGLTVKMVDQMLDFDYIPGIAAEEGGVPTEEKENHFDIFKVIETTPDSIQPQIIDYLHEQTKDELSKPEGDKKKTQFNLIDKFIEKNPRIMVKENIPPVVQDLSEESVKEGEFITETLAEIYIRQKKYDKAIQIYQKLSLKYPQKSIYFANSISKIEDLIQNDK
mgnify:CR=1 FL=1